LKSQTFKYLLRFIIVFVFPLHFSGCAYFGPTKPNIPYAGNPCPSILIELAQKNQLLVQELGKLPELQDGISETEIYALKKIVEMYNIDQANFENAFNKMHRIGLPEFRKYCSPLQALFWLAEDNELSNYNALISDYSLVILLDKAWKFDPLSYRLITDRQIREIIDSIENGDIRKQYLNDLQNGNTCYQLQSSFASDYRISKRHHMQIFSKKSAKIIEKNLLAPKAALRWEDFNTVVDRLNAPELLDYYINLNIKYKKNRTNSHTPKHTFLHHWGDCDDLAVFGKYILMKGGYKANPRYVYWTLDNRGHVGVVVILEDGRYLLAVDFGGRNRMSGPYTKISEVDKTLSGGHFINDSGWWQQPR